MVRTGVAQQWGLTKSIDEIVKNEKDFTLNTLEDDVKNFNVWSHRRWLFFNFVGLDSSGTVDKDAVDEEREFIYRLLVDDVRNNSAWNYRWAPLHFALMGAGTSEKEKNKIFEIEIIDTLALIASAPRNRAAWNFLFGLFQNPFELKPPAISSNRWTLPKWKHFSYLVRGPICDLIYHHDGLTTALSAYAHLMASEGNYQCAVKVMTVLAERQPTKKSLWEFRIQSVDGIQSLSVKESPIDQGVSEGSEQVE
eukprot:GHVN01070906.1.p1 GENE.GHVN01070906.1~~GHVN01070906.1.p1  ORF type:complete len:252 (+),score=42.36 GHVN01070906.1:644-1399(+)